MEKHRKTHRSEEEKKSLDHRLARIEGQVGGVRRMVDEDRYCADLLLQLSAIERAVRSLATEILEKHLRTCVVKEVEEEGTGAMEEAYELVRRWTR